MTSRREEFLAAVHADAPLWRSIDVRVVTAFAEGAWRNLITQCYLRGAEPDGLRVLPHPVRSPILLAVQHILPLEDLPDMLAAVESGEWTVGGCPVTYSTNEFGQGMTLPYGLMQYQFHRLDSRHVHPDFEWGGHVLYGGGDSCSTIVQRVRGAWDGLDAVARDQPYPFERLDEVVRYVTELRCDMVASRRASFEIVAPYEVRLIEEATELDGGKVHYALRAGTAAAAQCCRLRILPEPRGAEVPDPTVLPAKPDWRDTRDGGLTYAGEHLLAGTRKAAVVLGCGTRFRWLEVETYTAGAITVPLAIYRLRDPNLEILETWLSGAEAKGKNPQGKFELAVGRLFSLAGFQMDSFSGDKRLSDALDLIAHAPRQHTCLAVECTTGSIDAGGKLGKFVKRLDEVRRVVGGVRVVGLIVTSTTLEGIALSDLDRAHADGLIVLTGEDLTHLLEIVRGGTSVEAVLEYVERRPAHQRYQRPVRPARRDKPRRA